MRGQTNASNIGGNVGSNTRPIKIVNGQGVAIPYDIVPFNVIFNEVKYANASLGSGNNVLLLSAYNPTIESRLVIVAENNQCRLQLEKWTRDGSTMLSQSLLGSI